MCIYFFSSQNCFSNIFLLDSTGNATNQFINPFAIARDPTSGTLYITDLENNRIMSYASGANNGTLVFGFYGGAGTNNTQLYRPNGLYFDSITNSLLIANSGSNNIVRYVFGDSVWTLVAGNFNGSSGATSTALNTPVDMTLDPMGNMYVADGFNYRIQFYYAGQSNGTTIAGITGVTGNNTTTLNAPLSVALDSQLNLYVVDTYNHRVQKFLRY
jgi:sugar lactone lactonase YvrE